MKIKSLIILLLMFSNQIFSQTFLVRGEYENVINNSIELFCKNVTDKSYFENFIIINDEFKIYENKFCSLIIPEDLIKLDKKSLKILLKKNSTVNVLKINTVHINNKYNISLSPYKAIFRQKENEIVFLPSQTAAIFHYEYHKNEKPKEEWELKDFTINNVLKN